MITFCSRWPDVHGDWRGLQDIVGTPDTFEADGTPRMMIPCGEDSFEFGVYTAFRRSNVLTGVQTYDPTEWLAFPKLSFVDSTDDTVTTITESAPRGVNTSSIGTCICAHDAERVRGLVCCCS